MKESHDEGPASHIAPESCGGDRKVAGEALTGVRTGPVSSCEITQSGTPTPLSEAEGHIIGGNIGEPQMSPAQSQTLKEGSAFRCTRGNSLHGNRETPRTSAEEDESADR